MNILHITKKYPNALGGDTVVVSNLEKQQWKHGHKVAVLTSNCEEIQTKKHVYKFGLKDTPAALDAITPKRLLSLGHLFFKSFQVIRKERPDIIHTHSIDMAFAASFAAKFYKVPMVHTFHIVTFHDKKQSWLRRKTELLFKKGANPRIVTAPDQADIDHLKHAGVANATLLPNGIDLKFWHKDESPKNEVFTFISASRLETQKGIEYLVKAAAILKQKSKKPFKILVAGDGSQLQELGILAMDLNVTDNIEFIGRKTPEEVRAIYASSNAAVIPSLWESTPITLLEAWAMKLPVVCTPVGIVQGKTHEKDVSLVPPQDEKALAKAMRELLEHPGRGEKLAKKGYEAVQRYTWDKVYEVAENIYDGATKKPTAHIAQPEQATMPVNKPASAPPTFTARNLMLGLAATGMVSLATAPLLSGTINTLVTLPLAVLAPGLLLRFAAFRTLGGISVTATASIAMALGLLLTAAESLAINWLLPLIGIDAPLQAKYLVPAHIVLILTLLFAYLQKYGATAKDTLVKLHINSLQTTRFVVPLLLPLLATASAFRQNNGFGNELAVFTLAAMIGLALWFVIKPKAFNPAWLLFNIALGLLLSTSLRSWFVSGFDISQEFQVFNLTLQNHHWDLNAIPGNAYNACLSLTTLPAALAEFSGITAEYIFKYFYQVVFALTAVVIYLLGRRFADTRGAFLVGLFYVGQAQFIGTMPAIVRQQLGLLFFALIIYLLIEKEKMTRARSVLIGLLGLGMVLSHYSTTYITIFILLATAAVLWTMKIGFIRRRLPEFRPVLSAVTVSLLAVVLMGMSYVWYSVINSSSSNVSTTISASWHTLTSLDFMNGYTVDKNGQKTKLLMGGNRETAQPEDVANYKNALGIQESITYAETETLPTKSKAATWTADRIRDVLALIVKILLPLSPLLLLFFKKTRTQVADLSFLGVGAITTFVAFIFLPVLAQSYNLERVFQQTLILLAITGLWALWFILPARKQLNTIITAAFVLVFFAFSPGTGLINQFIGGTTPRLNMNSLGEEYQKYYVHESEVKAAEWLGKNCKNDAIWADRYTTLRVTAYAGVPYDSIRSDILKASKGCLMLDRANTQDDLYYASYKKRPVRYTIPTETFDKYNLIYSNGDSKVYQY